MVWARSEDPPAIEKEKDLVGIARERQPPPPKTRRDPLYTYINCTIRTYTLCGPYNGPIDLYTRRVLLVPATRTQGEEKGSTCEARMAHEESPTTREEAAAGRNKEVDVDTTMGLMVIY